MVKTGCQPAHRSSRVDKGLELLLSALVGIK